MTSTPPFRTRILYQPLRIFFKLLYHQMAWTYDWVAAVVSLGMWRQWIRMVIPLILGPRVLELGHGPGHLQETLMVDQHDWRVTGLDSSLQMNRQAYNRLERLGLSPRLINGLGQVLPFAGESFNTVVATFPTEYIVHPETLAEIQRVLVPGGRAVILPLAWITGRKPIERAAAWLFHVTGQAPDIDERILDPFRLAGFQASWELIDLPSSRLLIIEAFKGE